MYFIGDGSLNLPILGLTPHLGFWPAWLAKSKQSVAKWRPDHASPAGRHPAPSVLRTRRQLALKALTKSHRETSALKRMVQKTGFSVRGSVAS